MVGFTLLLSGAKGCWVQPPQHCLCFHMGLNFKLCAVCWAQATRHQAPCMENFHQSPPPMAQLLFYCKISIILQRKGQHALRWFSAYICHSEQSPCLGVLSLWTIHREEEYSSWSQPQCWGLFPQVHELFSNKGTEDWDRGLALNPKDLFLRTAGLLHVYVAHQPSHSARDMEKMQGHDLVYCVFMCRVLGSTGAVHYWVSKHAETDI